MRKALKLQKDKAISTGSLIELAETVLKNKIFKHKLSFIKQLLGTAIGTKMAPLYAIIFGWIFTGCDTLPLVWWSYIDEIFILTQHGEKEFKNSLEILNSYNPTIKFTANYLREKISFLDVEVIKNWNQLVSDLYIKPIDNH